MPLTPIDLVIAARRAAGPTATVTFDIPPTTSPDPLAPHVVPGQLLTIVTARGHRGYSANPDPAHAVAEAALQIPHDLGCPTEADPTKAICTCANP